MNSHHVALLFRSIVFLVIFALAPPFAHAIEAPRDTRGTILEPTQIKWEWEQSAGAVLYQVDVNGVFVEYVEGTEYRSTGLSGGDYYVTVQAVDSNNIHSVPSQRSATVTIGTGDSNDSRSNDGNHSSSTSSGSIPENIQGTQIGENSARFTWNQVLGASSYVVYVNGDGQNPIQTNNDNLVIDNLSAGEHSIKVAAVDSSTGRHSDQSAKGVVNINSDGSNSGNNNSVAPPPPENDNGLIDPASYNYSLKPGYNLVFSDEFNNNAINPNRWNTQLRWDGSWNGARYEYRLINGEAQFYVNTLSSHADHLSQVASVHNPFEFDGNRLAIRSIKNPLKNHDINTNYNPANHHDPNDNYEAYGPLDLMSRQQPFLSGVIASYDKFYLKYGYIEARIKIPSQLGTFPAFWLHHQNYGGGTRKTEIDIMENLGHEPRYVYTAGHSYNNVNSEGNGGDPQRADVLPNGQIGNKDTGIDYSQDYHIYAVDWSSGGDVRFLIDDVEVSRISDGTFDHEELYIIMNLAVGGFWTNGPRYAGGTGRINDGNQFPSRQDVDAWPNPAIEIDYVRAYKRQ